jgi:porin-like protein
MMHRKTQLAAAVGAALFAVGTSVFGQAATPAATVQVYGQVSRTLLFADDGTQSKWFHADNEASGTRFGVTGTGQALPGLRAGFRIEVDLQSNESQRLTFNPTPTSDFPATVSGAGFSERHMDAWLEGGWGRISMGQGDGAANGASESDLSGTGMANGIGVADLGGGFNYRGGPTGGTAFGPSITATINQQDFESRYDRLMYTTPTFGGFRVMASTGQKTNLDVKELSAWYGAKLGGFGELSAALGWSSKDATAPGLEKDEYVGGSISWLANFGLNLTYSLTKRDTPVATGGTRESTFNYFKVGWKFGAHAIAGDYSIGDDFAAVGDKAKMIGIGYVWNPIRWVEVYAGYKIHSLDRSGSTFEDVKIGHVGTRVRF